MEQRFLKKKRSKKVSRILTEIPEIGKEIENFVMECGAGADAWRRTGVITFDGNRKMQKKPTIKRVKEHLEEKFKIKISYGSVVQLCIARNRRRRSASRYKGVAKVLQKRARKGFTLKFNPDEHWSAAFYQSLNDQQFRDGEKVLNLGRDDQAGFRLDTMTTNKLHGTLSVKGHESLTTRTDYVNGYPSTLQVTSYNFPETENTAERCVGVVKARSLHEKNAAQHLADLELLSTKEILKPVFFKTGSDEPKEVEFVRVDGGQEEGPSHCEVKYWWTVHHLRAQTVATMVTTRNSGASYKNRVELQNGRLALGHANLFIPSTLNGSCLKDDRKVNETKLKENLSSAIDVYMSRVDGTPCASTEINLFRGADSAAYQNENKLVKVLLKGSKEAKEKLQKDHPDMHGKISAVLDLQSRHLFPGVPSKYVLYLRCCYEKNCIHPRCKQGRPEVEATWYPGGPPLSFLPLPAVDPERSYGSSDCSQCKGVCSGHYLKPEQLREAFRSGTYIASKPPSIVLLSKMTKLKYEMPDENGILELAKEVLLSPEDTRMWCEHLSQVHHNRVNGAKKKASAKQKSKAKAKGKLHPKCKSQSSEVDKCLQCGQEDPPGNVQADDDGAIDWICCDGCNKWCRTLCSVPCL